MSMRVLNENTIYKVSGIKNGSIGDFLNIHYWHFFSLHCLIIMKISRILRRRKLWVQSGLKYSTLGNKKEIRAFAKYPQLTLCFNDGALCSFKISEKSLVWILKRMCAKLWAKVRVKRAFSKRSSLPNLFTCRALFSVKIQKSPCGRFWEQWVSTKYSLFHFCLLTVPYHSNFQKIFRVDSKKKPG